MAKLKLKTRGELEQELHPKGWGFELWVENIPEYCGKILHFNKDKSCSMHFHMNKKETMWLMRGSLKIEMIDPENGEEYNVVLSPGDSVLIPPGQLHQIHALEESDLIEFSTMHEDSDSYRAWKGD